MNNPLEQPGVIVLETEPSDPTKKYPYKAILQRAHSNSDRPWERGFDGQWILKIIGIYNEGPSLTPGQWYLDTLLGYDDYGKRTGDFIFIDAGQHWGCGNMIAVLKEAEELAYGTGNPDIQEHMRIIKNKPLNEGVIEDLILKGPGREPLLTWAEQEVLFSLTDPAEIIRLYCEENEITASELQALATLYMEDADLPELTVLSDLVSSIAEGKREGELDEKFVNKYAHIPSHLRNWYQRPENQVGYEEPKSIRKKKPTKKATEQIENIEGEIQDIQSYLRIIQSDNKNRHNEAEEYMAEIIRKYDWMVLDILNSGLSKEEKTDQLKKWSDQQDEKIKEIKNTESLLNDHEYYYGEEKDKEEEELEKQIEEKEKELGDLKQQYDY
jgi:hypothetical protein